MTDNDLSPGQIYHLREIKRAGWPRPVTLRTPKLRQQIVDALERRSLVAKDEGGIYRVTGRGEKVLDGEG